MLDQEGLGSWVDATSVHSALAGLTVLLLSFWASYMLARLWQLSLSDDASEAIEHAKSLGLSLRPAGLRARVVVKGRWGATDAVITWKGGAFGERTVLMLGDRVRRMPMIRSGEELESTLRELERERDRESQLREA